MYVCMYVLVMSLPHGMCSYTVTLQSITSGDIVACALADAHASMHFRK